MPQGLTLLHVIHFWGSFWSALLLCMQENGDIACAKAYRLILQVDQAMPKSCLMTVPFSALQAAACNAEIETVMRQFLEPLYGWGNNCIL